MTDGITIVPATTPAPGWVGGFSQTNPGFAYPTTNLSALPLLGNMDNIPRLQRQLDVLWPEFFWNAVPGDDKWRCFQQFAPDISRAGYDAGGRVWSIICPQQGAYSPTLGSLNIEVTVTGQRGWIDESVPDKERNKSLLAIDMNVVGKVWFAPPASTGFIYNILKACLDSEGLPFPFSKDYAIQVVLHKVGDPNEPTIAVRSGPYDGGFDYPATAVHFDEAWGVANVEVAIGSIVSSNNAIVDEFNQLVIDIFNVVSGNVLKEGNVLTWNVWFDAPTLVDQIEWRDHAAVWRQSLDTGHGYPDGNGTPVPYYADGANFSVADVLAEELVQWEWNKINAWLKKHFGITRPGSPEANWLGPLSEPGPVAPPSA